MAFHGIITKVTAPGIRPVNLLGQSVLGTVIETTLPMDSQYEYNIPYYFTERPSDVDLGLEDANGALITETERSSQILDEVFANGRIPMQIVFVEAASATDYFTTTQTGTNAMKYSTAMGTAFLTTLSDKAFRIYEDSGNTYLTVNTAADTQYATEFVKLKAFDVLNIGTADVYRIIDEYDTITGGGGSNTDAKGWQVIKESGDTTFADSTIYVLMGQQPLEIARLNQVLGEQDDPSGLYALGAADRVTAPKILFSGYEVATKRLGGNANPLAVAIKDFAESLNGIAVLSGPGTTRAEAIAFAGDMQSSSTYLVDPHIVTRNGVVPNAPTVAGMIAVNDYENGFWTSPSNRPVPGALNTSRQISSGFVGSEADVLNTARMATIIKDNGLLLWGNEGLSGDPAWQFLQIQRMANAIDESLKAALRWALAKNITVRVLESIAQTVNAFLAELTAKEAISGGECYPSQANTAATIKAGTAKFVVEFSGVYPLQTLELDLQLVDRFLITNILNEIL